MSRVRKIVIGSLIAVVTLVGAPALPASADAIPGYWGTSNNTFSGAHTIGAFWTGNIVSFWQNALYAHYNGNGYAWASATGGFNGNTVVATQGWQSDHSIGNDGIVGPATWGQARFWHVNFQFSFLYGEIYDYQDNKWDPWHPNHFGLWRAQVWLFQPLGCDGVWYYTDHPGVNLPNHDCGHQM